MDMVLYALLKKQIGSGGGGEISDDRIREILTQFLLAHPEYIGATEEQVEQINANTSTNTLLYKTLYGVKEGSDSYPDSTVYKKNTEYDIPKGETIFFQTIPTTITINGTTKTINEREYTFPNITGKFTLNNDGYLFKGIAYDILNAIKNIAISEEEGNIISMKEDGLFATVDVSEKQDKETAVTHTKNTAAGSVTQPVYINEDGVATATTYSLGKSVPSDAVFTDTTYENKSAAIDGADLSLVTTGDKYIWNNKQNALTSQTAYSAQGSATKVPQITTNNLGQVTSITEVTITAPPAEIDTITNDEITALFE